VTTALSGALEIQRLTALVDVLQRRPIQSPNWPAGETTEGVHQEWALRHPDGTIDQFADQQWTRWQAPAQYPDSTLVTRVVLTVRGQWSEVPNDA